MRRATLALLIVLLLPVALRPAGGREHSFVAEPHPPGLLESAITSCAGGALIGALLVYAATFGPVGLAAVGPGAGLFCGLSVVASVFSAAGDRVSIVVDRVFGTGKPAAPEASP